MTKHPILCILFYFILSIGYANDPEIRINESFTNTSLKEVLSVLQRKYDLKIAYGDQLVNDITITTSIIDLTVHETFQALLDLSPLTFEILEQDVIILYKSDKNPNSSTEYSIIGVVQDASSGERLPYAYVWDETAKTNLVTNVDGYFTFRGTQLPSSLVLSYLGYQDTVIIIDENSINKRLYVNMIPNTRELEEVVITDKKNNDFMESEEIGKLDINPKIAYSVPAAGETDLLRTLQLLPGINATNENSSGLVIQGGTANQNLFLFDGFTVYHVDHFFGYFSAFNPFAVKSIHLYKGAYNASYGGRVSGVVDISGKEGNLKKTSGYLSASLLSVNSSLEIPIVQDKTSLFFSARRSYTDIISTSLFEKIFSNFTPLLSETQANGNNGSGGGMHHGGMGQQQQVDVTEQALQPDFYYSDLNFRISSKIGLKNHFSFSFYDSNDLLNFTESTETVINDTLDVSQKSIGVINWGNIGSSIKWSRLWNSNHYSNLLFSYSHYKSTYDDVTTSITTGSDQVPVGSSTMTDQKNEIRDMSFKLDHEWFLTNTQSLRLGVNATRFSTHYRNVTDTIEIVDEVLDNKYQVSVFGIYDFHLSERFNVNLGFRDNYYEVTNKWYPEPRISAGWNVHPTFRVKAGYGIYHQFINQSNTKNALQGSRDFWILADNDRIPVQRANHYMTGFEYNRGSILLYGEYFRRDYTGLLEYAFSNGGLVTEFPNYRELFFEGVGYSEGFELLIKRSAPIFNAWAGYTMSTVRHQFDDLNDGREYYADHDQRHEVNLYGSLKWKQWELFTTWLYGSGKPYSANNEFNNSDNPHIMLVDEGDKNNARLPDYHRLDAGLKYNTTINNIIFSATLNIFNIYNRQNTLDYRINRIAVGHQGGHNQMDTIAQINKISSIGFIPSVILIIGFN